MTPPNSYLRREGAGGCLVSAASQWLCCAPLKKMETVTSDRQVQFVPAHTMEREQRKGHCVEVIVENFPELVKNTNHPIW